MTRILISGASGFIGRALSSYLASQGHTVFQLVRSQNLEERKEAADAIFWNPEEGKAIQGQFEGFDAVFNLAGEPIAAARWTRLKKQKILYSRTAGTSFLSQILSQLMHPPKFFLSASAIGFYGDRGDEALDERSKGGEGFLAAVCGQWEKATLAAENRGIRTVHARFGMVLGKGGALQKMLPIYKLGFGGRIGSGCQWVSWIGLEDLIRAMNYIWRETSLEGAVNCVSPHPVRQEEFSRVLAQVLQRPDWIATPAWLLKLLWGQMAKEVLLASTKALPSRLAAAHFCFHQPNLFQALRKVLQ